MGLLSDAPIFIDDSATNTIVQMRTKARRLHLEHHIGLIIVDYLQLMETRTRVENRVQEIAEITRSLKALARELNIPVLALSQLSRAVEMSKPAIPKLAHLRESGCLAGDTLITRADTGERIPIKDLVGQKNIPVLSLNTKSLQIEKKYISKVFSSGHKQLFELKTRSGRIIKASANHPFFTIEGWRRLDTLNCDDLVAIPRVVNLNLNNSPLKNNELILLAHLTGDGCVLRHQPIHYTSADQENIQIVAKTAKDLFGIKPRIIKQKNWYHVYLPSPYQLARGRHHPIIQWFKQLGLEPVRSYEKTLPSVLFQCSVDSIELFLRHLWATDGNISWKKIDGRKPAGAIYYSTTSKTLADQVQHLLLRLNISSSLRAVKQQKGLKEYRLNYQKKSSQPERQIARRRKNQRLNMRQYKSRNFKRQPRKGEQKWQRLKILTASAALFLVFAYLRQVNTLSIKGFQIKDLDKDIKVLKTETQQLELTLASEKSLNQINERVKKLNMVPVDQMEYLRPIGNNVALGR